MTPSQSPTREAVERLTNSMWRSAAVCAAIAEQVGVGGVMWKDWAGKTEDLRLILAHIAHLEAEREKDGEALLKPSSQGPVLPVEGCYCKNTCGAPSIMGRQMPCLRNPAFPLSSRGADQ